MNYDFTEDEKQDIIQMYKNENKMEEIIEKYNTDEHYVRLILKDHKIDRNYNRWSDELYNRISYLYSLGDKTQKQVAYITCCSDEGVRKALAKCHVKLKTPSEANQKYNRNSKYFSNIDTPNKAYFLGLIYADGNVSDNNRHVGNRHYMLTITLQEEDVGVLERIKDDIEYSGPLRYYELSKKYPNHKNVYTLCINDQYMIDDLIQLGVPPRKSLILTFPIWLRPDLVRHFIRGYFDGDGNIYHDIKHNKWRACIAGTYEFCIGVQRMCEAYYIKTNIYHPKQCLDHNTYVLQCSASNSTYQFLSFLYQDCDIKMDRKYNSYLQFREEYKNHKDNIKSF